MSLLSSLKYTSGLRAAGLAKQIFSGQLAYKSTRPTLLAVTSSPPVTLPSHSLTRCQTTRAAAQTDQHSHTNLWKLERIVSAALLAAIPAGLLFPNSLLDYALALSLTIHVHWGIEAIVVDYVRPRLFGPVIPKVALGLVYLLSILTLSGLFYFNYNDVGVSHGIRMFLNK